MNKNDFFNSLINKLQYIPEKQLQELISYYESLFDQEVAKGKSEEEIINSLGNVDEFFSNGTLYKKTNQDLNSSEIAYTEKTISEKKSININSNLNDNTVLNTIDSETHPQSSKKITNLVLKICISILLFIIFSPVLSAFLGILIGAFGTSIGLFTGSIGVLIGESFFNFSSISGMPKFITNLPPSAIILFSLGTMCLGLLLFFSLFYMCKFIILIIRKMYIKLFCQEDR